MTSEKDRLRKQLAQRLEAFAQEKGYTLSSSAESIINDLVQMHGLMGDFYCPCQPGGSPATVCVCEAVRQGLVDELGACFCHLFRKSDVEALI